MEARKEPWSATAPSPPPYAEAEADAYPTTVRASRERRRRRRRLLHGPLPVPIWACLTCLVVVLVSAWGLYSEVRSRYLVVARGQQTVGNLSSSSSSSLSNHLDNRLQQSLAQCVALHTFPERLDPARRTENPRWNAVNGQKGRVVLRNATLFDGESTLPRPMDVVFDGGIIRRVAETSSGQAARMFADRDEAASIVDVVVVDLHGAFVTPGLVDMHSHHLLLAWPVVGQTSDDTNEVAYGPLTPFVRALDGLKAYDTATELVASGGVTTSLVIPGSANIMGGEGAVVKNRLRSGPGGELVVEDMLLEHGIPEDMRHRYMKMACGENPREVYGHTRMGNAWELRNQLHKARELMARQDEWCAAADEALHQDPAQQRYFLERYGAALPSDLALESTVGMLRGRVAMHNHCYEPEDMETMLRISHEFGFRVRAFHHALAAWQVPGLLLEQGENLTIATFAEYALYKVEAYQASLAAGRILDEAGLDVAYKSDHVMDSTSAKFLMSQAAIGHSFGLRADRALAAVTSVPARAIDVDDRIGYVRAGFDADLVVWDAHPLSTGATPREVWIDGVALVEPMRTKRTNTNTHKKTKASTGLARDRESGSGSSSSSSSSSTDGPMSDDNLRRRRALPKEPAMRPRLAQDVEDGLCSRAEQTRHFVISGIRASFLDKDTSDMTPEPADAAAKAHGNLTLVINSGNITCLDAPASCASAIAALGEGDSFLHYRLTNGHLSPGLTAVTAHLGMQEIDAEPATGDGPQNPYADFAGPDGSSSIAYAKYGVTLDGKAFARARLGGVTRAVSPPVHLGGPVQGVSVGIRTGGARSLLDGGIFQDEVALHVWLGNEARVSPGSISQTLQNLRALLATSRESDNDTAFGRVADGKMPMVVQAESEHDVQQVVLLKRDFEGANIVILGGHGTHAVAKELAAADIPVILTSHRGSPDLWQTKDSLPGPPLSRSLPSVLTDAGVSYAIALHGKPPQSDARLHDLAFEAAWAAKYAGLDDRDALRLVSRGVEDVLGLPPSRDVVVWEGDPLAFGSPALVFEHGGGADGRLQLVGCWPGEEVDR